MSTVSKVRDAFKGFIADITREASMLGREADLIEEERSRARSEVLESASHRLPKGADDLRKLDEELGGILGVASGIDALRGKQSRLVLEKDLAGKEREKVNAAWTENKAVIKACQERITDLEARARQAESRISVFDARFVDVHGYIRKWDVRAPRERLESPRFIDLLINYRLFTAGSMVRNYGLEKGRSYHDVLENEYLPLIKEKETLDAQVAQERVVMQEAIRGNDALKRPFSSAADRLKRATVTLDEVERQLDNLDVLCRDTAANRIGDMVDDYDTAFRRAKKPVRNGNLDALTKAGLLSTDDLGKVARHACLGIVLDSMRARVDAFDNTARTLRSHMTKLDGAVRKGRGSRKLDVNLASIETALRDGSKVNRALCDAAEEARNPSRTFDRSTSDSSDMFGIQLLTIWWMTNQSSAQDETLHGMPADLSPNAMPEIPAFDMGSVLKGMGGFDTGLRGLDLDVGRIDLGSDIDRTISAASEASRNDGGGGSNNDYGTSGNDYSSGPSWD